MITTRARPSEKAAFYWQFPRLAAGAERGTIKQKLLQRVFSGGEHEDKTDNYSELQTVSARIHMHGGKNYIYRWSK